MKVSVVQMNMRSLAGKENFDRAEALELCDKLYGEADKEETK